MGKLECSSLNVSSFSLGAMKCVPVPAPFSSTDKPEGTTLTTSVAGNTAVQGDSVTFTCKVAGAKPAVSGYRIYFNDSNTPLTEPTDGRYTINNVQRSQHFGRYKCVPYNDAGNGPQATVQLNINGKNMISMVFFIIRPLLFCFRVLCKLLYQMPIIVA